MIGIVIIDPREMTARDPDNTTQPAYRSDKTGQFSVNASRVILEQADGTGEILFFNRYTGQNIAQ